VLPARRFEQLPHGLGIEDGSISNGLASRFWVEFLAQTAVNPTQNPVCLPLPATIDFDITPANDHANLERLAEAFDELEHLDLYEEFG
jgi:hypothetical protein